MNGPAAPGGEGMIRSGLAAAVVAACAVAGGCQAPMLSADDTVIIGNRKSHIHVCAMRPGLLTLGRRIAGVDVTVYVGDKEAARGRTNVEGNVDLDTKLPKGTREFEARAVIGGAKLTSRGHVFTWPERTAVVVDVDQTISDTDYRALVWGVGQDSSSRPLPDSAETLNQIARHFNIFYLTARPREMLEKTRQWIKRNGFPAAPIVTSDSLSQLADLRKYKLDAVKHIQAIVPHLLIGIGDQVTDSDAYGQAGLLTLALTEGEQHGFCGHPILLPDWKAVGDFFRANLRILKDYRCLEMTIRCEGMLLRPTLRWTPKK